ncbi:hypothetical protein [Citrobacter tructae]|uniref:hypothetical protein n=1 Tax=Citrobacter tructae TaxID=2562449 RepID=UPI003F54C266
MKKNIAAVESAVGDIPEAKLKLLSGMMMTGSLIAECVGFMHMLTIPQPWKLAPNVPRFSTQYVHPLLRGAGVIAGVAAIIDGIGYLNKGWNANIEGDSQSTFWYTLAAGSTIAGGTLAAAAAYSCQFALMGPAGWAAILILTGAILATEAENARSTPFEIWLHRCCFGIPREKDVVWAVTQHKDQNQKNLNAALSAFNATINGMTAELIFQDVITELFDGKDVVGVKIVLPCCNKQQAAWEYRLTLKGTRSLSPLLSVQHNTDSITDHSEAGKTEGYLKVSERWNEKTGGLTIEWEAEVNSQDVKEAELSVKYWPDRTNPDGLLALQVSVED